MAREVVHTLLGNCVAFVCVIFVNTIIHIVVNNMRLTIIIDII